MKWIPHYLRGTINIGLIYDRGSNTKGRVESFIDSNYAFDLGIKRSLKCYVFSFLGYVISWKIILQSTITLSTKNNKHMSGVLYASIVGSMLYATIFTYLDISYAISVVIKFIKISDKVH